MASIADAIAGLINPIPCVLDPEDDVNETVPKINQDFSRSGNHQYDAGKKIARKDLHILQEEVNTLSKDDGSEIPSEDSGNSDVDEVDSSDDQEAISDADLENFKTLFKGQQTDSDVEDADSEQFEESEFSDAESSEDVVNKFANIDVSSEVEKGAAVKAQLELWNRLSESRIKLQKLLIIANKLPQSDCWKMLKMKDEKDLFQCAKKGSNSVKRLLNSCLNLETELLERNPETRSTECSDDKKNSNENSSEEIPSNTDEEMEVSEGNETNKTENRGLKRKLKIKEYSEIIAKRYKSLIPYRNSVIQKWDDKTRLSFGSVTQKSFSAFDISALNKIEQVLQDKSRLVKRTQLKRSLYRVLGKSEEKTDADVDATEPTSKQDMLLKDYDPEIFDDDDFYGQLLKDIIESNTAGMNPALIRKQMAIQSARHKMKRQVDTKASKGRKIRFDVHPKLVNFMAPVKMCTISDEARASLLKTLFGRRPEEKSS